jgi:hypothetical protein
VLGLATPHIHLEEGGVAVAPLPVVLEALGDGNAQVGDWDAGIGKAQLGGVDQLAGDGGRSPKVWPVRPEIWNSAAVGLGDSCSSPVIYANVMIP